MYPQKGTIYEHTGVGVGVYPRALDGDKAFLKDIWFQFRG